MNIPEKDAKEKRYDVDAVKNRLNAYRDKEREIDIKVERLDTLVAKMNSIGSPGLSDMPKAQGVRNDKMERNLERKEELQNTIQLAIEEQRTERNLIEEILEKLSIPDEREVICIRYFEGNSWSETSKIMFGMKCDYERKQDTYLRRTFKVHGSALLHIAMLEEQETKEPAMP